MLQKQLLQVHLQIKNGSYQVHLMTYSAKG